MATLDEIRTRNPDAIFTEVEAGSLPRNHVGFFRTDDGHPYVNHWVSPRRGQPGRLFIDYEPADPAGPGKCGE